MRALTWCRLQLACDAVVWMLHVQPIAVVSQTQQREREGGGIQARQRFLPPTSAFPARADGRRDKSLLVRIDLSELLSQLLSSFDLSLAASGPIIRRHPAPLENWHRPQRTASKSAPVSNHEESSPPPPPHPPAHAPTSRLRAPTRTTINMAPSFEQLDPEQAEYDGEEDIDFSGTPARRHNTPDACAEERRC